MELLETQIKAFLSRDVGNGSGYGDGDGYGSGNGSGYGYGYGSGDGDGYGNGDGVSEIEGHKVYKVDEVNTIITAIHGNVAQGCMIAYNTKLIPCFIVKGNNSFAHGETLHDAYAALQEKLYDNSTKEERIAAFKEKFPEFDTPYDNADLFVYHHVLTGSCRMGRENFVANHGIGMDGKTTVRAFIALTEDSYGGDVIKKLKQAYDNRQDLS